MRSIIFDEKKNSRIFRSYRRQLFENVKVHESIIRSSYFRGTPRRVRRPYFLWRRLAEAIHRLSRASRLAEQFFLLENFQIKLGKMESEKDHHTHTQNKN